MAYQLTVYTVALLATATVSFGLAFVAFRNRDQRTALPLMGIMLAAGIWCFADGMRIANTTEGAKIFWNNVRFLGPTLVVPSVFLLAAEFTNRGQWMSRQRLVLLAIPEILTNLAVWTNPYHGMLRTGTSLTTEPGYVAMEISYGSFFWAEAAYHYVVLVVATYWFVQAYWKARKSGSRIYQRQAGIMLGAVLIPWGASMAFVTDTTQIDGTPFGFVATAILMSIAVFQYRLMDLVPIASDTVVENMDSGVLVLDEKGQIVDVNPRAERIIGTGQDQLLGVAFADVFSQYPELIRRFGEVSDTHDQVSIVRDGNEEHYDVEVSPLYDSIDREVGRVIVFSDITAQIHRQQELREREQKLRERTRDLERQNDRLDEFASIVSHDIRNPLNSAKGHLELGLEEVDGLDEHDDFVRVQTNLERIQAIIEDVLEIARQGQTVDEREPLDLKALCADAWKSIDNPTASLTVRDSRTIMGDGNRLLQVFENLFRNAIDHGGADVSIEVGVIEGGFYVADDGTGIPADQREQVFERGHTTDDEGTGFGLSIVKAAVESHGWTIALTESRDGGARFEITGLNREVQTPAREVAQD